MSRIGPANRWNGDEVMAEVDKDVNACPAGEHVGLGVVGAAQESIVVITAGHVVAQQRSTSGAIVRFSFGQWLKNTKT